MDPYDNVSPLDYRYYKKKKIFQKLSPYISEEANIKYQLRVEAALTEALADRGLCSKKVAEEVKKATERVTAEEVYKEDKRIHHYTRALVNCISEKVSEEARPFIHLSATSFDILDTADALRYKEVAEEVLIPDLLKLEEQLIEIARREKDTLQIGRTHGQHAEPITFGFALAEYISRLGNCIRKLKQSASDLRGQLSGAVGAYNASSLLVDDPEELEREFLKKIGLKPASHSIQIVEPEYSLEYFHSIISCFGVLANLADDLRHLQRSEIEEVAEKFEKDQVGSSTMPHKRNPWNFEHIKSMWKAFMPRMVTLYLDQVTEHQRDLSNSASGRFKPELIAGFYDGLDRMLGLTKKLIVDREKLQRNFDQNREMLTAEPLYILLSFYGHPEAHETVRKLTLKAEKTGEPLVKLFQKDKKLKKYWQKFSEKQKKVLRNPENYTGKASEKTEEVCKKWKKELGI